MRARYLVALAAAAVLAVTAAGYALAAGGLPDVTFAGCLAGGKLANVRVTSTPTCATSATPVQWAGKAAVSVSPSPSPTVTTPTPAPVPTPTGACVVTDPGTCGAYADTAIFNSNGYNTYDLTNCWADPGCGFTLTAPGPGGTSAAPWAIQGSEPAGNTSVRAYPEEQQLLSDYCGNGTWNNCQPTTDTPLAALSSFTSTYSETFPHNAGTDAQAAYDVWLSGQGAGNPTEVMIWVDNVSRGDGGATQVGTANFGGQDWTLYLNGTDELIWSLGAPGTFAQQGSGTVDLGAMLTWLVAHGFEGSGTAIGQLDFGWEICSTGGTSETFQVSAYSVAAAAN